MTEEQINTNALKYARENSQPVLHPDDNGDIISDFDDLVCAYIEGAHSIKKEYDNLNKDMQWLLKRLRESAIRLHKARNPWISVEDRLPDIGQKVITITNKGKLLLVARTTQPPHKEEGGWRWEHYIGKVTHWMPIPKLKEERV